MRRSRAISSIRFPRPNKKTSAASDRGNILREEKMSRLRVALTAAVLAALAALPSLAAEPIKLGFSMALTGGVAVNGKQCLLALQIWRDDVNAKGGLLGRPVDLVYYDDQSNPANVPGIYTKL